MDDGHVLRSAAHRLSGPLIAGWCVLFFLMLTACASTGRHPRVDSVSREMQGASLLGRKLYSRDPAEIPDKLVDDLREARARRQANPDDPDALIWAGRRLGYLWRMRDAVQTYSEGIERWPDNPALYRHRGHRYLSLREFERAARDLEDAARLAAGQEDVIEQDGMPNDRGIPLTTLKFNIWYHLGVVRHVQGRFDEAVAAFRAASRYGRGLDDNRVAVTDWIYLSLRLAGRHAEARRVLNEIKPPMDIIENHAYYNRILFYKGLKSAEEVVGQGDALQSATSAYGVAIWDILEGREASGKDRLRALARNPYWPAFGVIAAEAAYRRSYGDD